MKLLTILIIATFTLLGSSVADPQKETFNIFTIRQRKVCLVSETQMKPSAISAKATDSLEIDEAALLKIFDLLKVHLYKNIDPSRFNERYYPQADLVFGFDEYYLQFVPFRSGTKRMVYINAYRSHCDIGSHENDPLPKDLVWVMDGGSNYWQIIYDLDEEKFLELRINGLA